METPGHLFSPKPDITVWELATILSKILEGQDSLFLTDIMQNLPPECLRHFVEKPSAEAVLLQQLV